MIKIHHSYAGNAIKAVTSKVPAPIERMNMFAVDYADRLGRAHCLSDRERRLLAIYKEHMFRKEWDIAYPLAASVVNSLIRKGCNPIDREKLQNLVPYFNYYGSYYWKSMESMDKYLMAYDYLLDSLKESIPEYGSRFDAIQKKLRVREESVVQDVEALNYELVQRLSRSIEIPTGCSKLAIFLRRIKDLAWKSHATLLLVYLPAENHIRIDYANNYDEDDGFCGQAEPYQILCIDLTLKMINYYLTHDEGALYLDGAHLNEQGHKMVAGWMYEALAQSSSASLSTLVH